MYISSKQIIFPYMYYVYIYIYQLKNGPRNFGVKIMTKNWTNLYSVFILILIYFSKKLIVSSLIDFDLEFRSYIQFYIIKFKEFEY